GVAGWGGCMWIWGMGVCVGGTRGRSVDGLADSTMETTVNVSIPKPAPGLARFPRPGGSHRGACAACTGTASPVRLHWDQYIGANSCPEGETSHMIREPDPRARHRPRPVSLVDRREHSADELAGSTAGWRLAPMSVAAIVIGVIGAVVALGLLRLIGLFTNLFFFGRWDTSLVSPAGNQLGLLVLGVPVVGALIVGLMARYGS